MLDIDWKGLALPFAYVLVLGSALMTFSTIYRKRKSGMPNVLFGQNLALTDYVT